MMIMKTTTMSKKTHERRLIQLLHELRKHPHREEVVALAMSQLLDMDSVASA